MTPLIAARRYFWGAYSFSTLGRFVHGMALSWVVWTQTHSPLWLSAIALLSALPSLPLAPVAGECWLVAAGADGEWSGRGGTIAIRTDGGWRFVPPFAGAHLYLAADRQWVRYEDGHWDPVEIDGSAIKVNGVQVVGAREDPISGPSGGITVDGEARTAIGAILVALRSHGLIST